METAVLSSCFEHYAYVMLFVWVLIEQIGVPIPSAPILLAAGSSSTQGRLNLLMVLTCVIAACLISDSAWFMLGRRYGRGVFEVMCKVAFLSPITLISAQENMNEHGRLALLAAKFIPGLGTLVPPLAACSGMSFSTFLFSDAVGSAIWAVVWVCGGRIIAQPLSEAKLYLSAEWKPFMLGLICLFVVASLWRVSKYLKFAAVVRSLQLEPYELHDLISSAAERRVTPPFIIDVRQTKDVQDNPLRLPNALRLPPSALKQSVGVLPIEREVILYCSCPGQATSVFWAMRLNRMGAQRVRLLHGGWEAWRDAGYSFESGDDLGLLEAELA
jgi:membrane protein DedA with SNARE-associated domain/rhodanese-related sulfurtransferase